MEGAMERIRSGELSALVSVMGYAAAMQARLDPSHSGKKQVLTELYLPVEMFKAATEELRGLSGHPGFGREEFSVDIQGVGPVKLLPTGRRDIRYTVEDREMSLEDWLDLYGRG